MGLMVQGAGEISAKSEPFTPKDEKTGMPGGKTFYSVDIGFIGGKVKASCDAQTYQSLNVGDKIKFRGGMVTEGGKTKVTLTEFQKAA